MPVIKSRWTKRRRWRRTRARRGRKSSPQRLLPPPHAKSRRRQPPRPLASQAQYSSGYPSEIWRLIAGSTPRSLLFIKNQVEVANNARRATADRPPLRLFTTADMMAAEATVRDGYYKHLRTQETIPKERVDDFLECEGRISRTALNCAIYAPTKVRS